MVNGPLIRPYLGGVALGGGTLDSHDMTEKNWVSESSSKN